MLINKKKKHWITETLLDKEIDQLNISQNKRSHKKNIKLKIAMLGRKQKTEKVNKRKSYSICSNSFINGKK